MAEMLLAYNNRIETAVLTGGATAPTMPLENLLDAQLGVIARWTNIDPANTYAQASWSEPVTWRTLAWANHNLGLQALHRVRGHSESPTANLFTYTEDLTGASWVPAEPELTVLPNAGSAPDSAPSADLLHQDVLPPAGGGEPIGLLLALAFGGTTGGLSDAYISQSVTITGGMETYSVAIFLRGDTAASTYIDADISDGSDIHAVVGGIITWSDPAAYVEVENVNGNEAILTEANGGWYRWSCQLRNPGPGTSLTLRIRPANEMGLEGSIYAWGAWAANESDVSSYYPRLDSAEAERPLGYFDAWQAYDYDSGWLEVYPSVYATEDTNWEDDNFWSGKYLESDLEDYIPTLCHVAAVTARAQHLRWDFNDQGNADGFLQAGRWFVAPGWQPVYNADFGASLGWETDTEVQTAISSAEFFDPKPTYRVARFRFANMTEDEGLGGPFEIMRRSGVHKEVLFMWDPDDTVHALRRQFLGRLRQLSPLEFPDGFVKVPGEDGAANRFRTAVPMEVKERVP